MRIFAHKIARVRKMWVKDLLLATAPRASTVSCLSLWKHFIHPKQQQQQQNTFSSLSPSVSMKAEHWVHLLALLCFSHNTFLCTAWLPSRCHIWTVIHCLGGFGQAPPGGHSYCFQYLLAANGSAINNLRHKSFRSRASVSLR